MNKEENDSKRYVWFDWAVKHMLRDKANFEVLEGLISVITGRQMKVIEVLESEANQKSATAKFNRVDIKARNEQGEIVIIEVQNIREIDFLERILFGVATTITEQVGLGERYGKIKKVYSIDIVYFDYGIGEDYVYYGQTEFHGIHTHDKLIINSRERLGVRGKAIDEIFPEYYLVRVEKFNPGKLKPNFMEQWMDYLKTGRIRSEYDAPGLQKAREALLYDRMSPAEKKLYRDHIDDVRIQQEAIDSSRAEGIAEGFSRGLAKGREEGIEEGISKGIMDTARRLLDMGMDTDTIARATGLGEEEIDALR